MPPRLEDTFEPLAASDAESFEAFYRIYAESISPRERKSREQIEILARRPDYRVLLAMRGGEVIGFSVLFVPAAERFSLLEYMAVDERHRQGGTGSALLRRTFEAATEIQGEAPLLVEVDAEAGASEERELCRRRQSFYRRHGCLRVEDLSYILPLSLEGPPPEMDLLLHPPPGLPALSRATLERWLKIIYQEVYDCPSDDPRIARMLEPVPDPVVLA